MSSELHMIRGDDPIFDIEVTDPGDPDLDLNAYENIWFTAKRRLSDADEDAVIRKTLGDGIEIEPESGPTDKAVLTIAAADTADLPDRISRLVWDVQVRDADGHIATIASGTLVVTPDVTRATGDES